MLTGRIAVLTQPFTVAQDGLTENAGDFGLWTSVTCHSDYSFKLFLNPVLRSLKSLKKLIVHPFWK
jgi:hypothetical protein